MNIKGMKVLSVDDNANNLLMIEVFAKGLKLEIDSYNNPREALAHIGHDRYDIYIVDYMMPDVDGLAFIEAVRQVDETAPIIMITANGDDVDLHQNALAAGATDFMTKPVNGTIFKLRVRNLLMLHKSQLLIESKAALLEDEVKKATMDILDSELETLNVVGKTAEYKDPETGAHIYRVCHYARTLARACGLTETMQDVIFNASPLHDIGKVGVPDSILLKPGPLDEDEWVTMKNHTLIGYEILKKSKSKYLKAGAIIAFSHHEKYDGTGYPKGLKGESIPLFGRIVAICDVFDALTSKRPYKDAWSFDRALDYMNGQKGKHFDSELIAHFNDSIDDIRKIYDLTDIEV